MQIDVFQVLADPTRRQIIEVLQAGEQQVNDVVAGLSIHQSGVSRHLRILLEAGFVQVRPDGQRRFYSLRPEPLSALDAWLAPYRDAWERRFLALHTEVARGRRQKTPAKGKPRA